MNLFEGVYSLSCLFQALSLKFVYIRITTLSDIYI